MEAIKSEVKLPSAADMGTTISFHASYGGGVKKHKEATKELHEAKGITNKKRAAVTVNLFSSSSHLDTAKKMGQALRNFINEKTVPWGDDGRRFLPNAIKPEIDAECVKRIAEIESEMELHFSTFPAQEALWNAEGGGLAKYGIEFPSVDAARAKFHIDIIPGTVTSVDDIRVGGLPREMRERFIQDVKAAEKTRMEGTVRNVADRVEEVLTRMVDRMGAYGKDADGKVVGRFHDTIITNVRDIAGLLEHFNITDDPAIEEVRRRLVNDICPVSPEALRESPELRKDIQTKATDILSKVGRFGTKRDF